MYTNDSSHFEKHHTTTTNRINTHFFSPHEAPQMCDIYATVIQLPQFCHNFAIINFDSPLPFHRQCRLGPC